MHIIAEKKGFTIFTLYICCCLVFGLFMQGFISLSTTHALMGIGISPPSITVENALRNETYSQAINVLYQGESQVTLEVTASGDISDWVTFYGPDDSSTPIKSIVGLPGEWTYVEARFIVPDNAPVGQNTGAIYVTAIPPESKTEEGKTGVIMKIQQEAPVSIEVAGHAVLSGTAESISTVNTEIGQILRIKYRFQNTGNLTAIPEATVDIIQNGATIDSFTSMGQSIMPSITQSVDIEWPTAGRLPGDYSARVRITLDGEELAASEVTFTLLPTGTLTRSGFFDSLLLDDTSLEVGALAKVLASFSNIGKLDTKAQFLAEVYRDGELTDSIVSAESFVPVRESVVITCYYKVDSPGDYQITGYINYEGKHTDVREASFEVIQAHAEETVDEVTPAILRVTETPEPANHEANPGEEGNDDETPTWYLWTAIAIIAVVVLIVGNTFISRKMRMQSKV